MNELTHVLNAVGQGDPKAAEELLPLVYEELRKLAAHKMANEAPGQTLQPTALVHEAWLRLAGPKEQRWQNRSHFFGAAEALGLSTPRGARGWPLTRPSLYREIRSGRSSLFSLRAKTDDPPKKSIYTSPALAGFALLGHPPVRRATTPPSLCWLPR